MKKLISLVVLCIFIVTTGCASFGGAKAIDPDYAAYTATVQAQLTAAQKPLVDIKVDADGRISAIVMNQPPKYIQVEQKNPHPAWRVAGSLVRVCGIVGGIWATGEALEGVLGASSGTSTYINSANNNSENTGTITSDYNDIVTTTTNNSTETQ